MSNDEKVTPTGRRRAEPATGCGHGGETGRDTSWSGSSSSTYGRDGTQLDPAGTDRRIFDDVCGRLMETPALDASGIRVAVTNGEVTLTGTVPGDDDKRLSEELIGQIPGTRGVRNELRVRRQE